MKRLHFETVINAPRKTIWQAMLSPDTYRAWTAPFAEGSYFEGSWEKGGRIRFLGPDGNGMSSVIADNRPNEFVSIRHVGFIKDGVEDTESEEVRRWTPAFENYTLSDEGGGATRVAVDQDITEEYADYMDQTWPKALGKLKEISESRSDAASS
jgi:uncharacterized protein YndB with AHSA1/START domain